MYNAVGEITEVKDTKGNKTKIEYDMLGRRTIIDNPDAGKTEFKYDLSGNLIEKIDAKLKALGQSIKYVYELNRLKMIDYPGNETDVKYVYGDKTATQYNQAGRIISTTDESGETKLRYGKLGEVVRTEKILTPQPPLQPQGLERGWGSMQSFWRSQGEKI